MRIAVASTDGKNVNEHFGRAGEFLIFDLSDKGPAPVEQRKITPLSVGDKNHSFDQARFDEIVAKISDCSRVYVSKIGEKPASELLRRGITPVLFHEAIDRIVI